MRPVRRGSSPFRDDFDNYEDAKPYLIGRLGPYCSYCERRIATMLAVEHIQPSSLYPDLANRWENFLLSCVNCNSTKRAKNVILSEILLPDRDNTFVTYAYTEDGKVIATPGLPEFRRRRANDTLALTGLDKRISEVTDENGKLVAIDRVAQRMEAWVQAQSARDDLETSSNNQALRRQIVRTAIHCGFFSIWLTVFSDDADIRNRLIDEFPGTRASGCFDPRTTHPIAPAPNPDQLPDGSKA